VEEAKKMLPSRNLFSPASGAIMYTPTLETQLGLYGITQVGRKTNKSFKTISDVKAAVRKGEVGYTDQVRVGGLTSTTGRFMVAEALPSAMRKSFLKKKEALSGKDQKELLAQLAKNHRNDFGESVNRLKNLGNQWSTATAFSIGLDDIKPEKTKRDAVMKAADTAARAVRRGAGTQAQKDAKVIQIYDKATQQMQQGLKAIPESDSGLMTMNHAGIKPGMDALRQIKMAPMLIANAKGEIIPEPVRRSYAEGLDLADYWTSMSGARKGIIQKVQEVQEPGYVSKQIMNSVMNNLIADDDCGTDKGISLGVDEKDVLDRFLAAPVKAGTKTLRRGTLITPDVRNTLRNNKVGKVVVRSPLRCQHGPGICKRCYGLTEDGSLPEKGLNVGILAGQSLGERATQLSMKAFHTGGSAASMEDIVDEFQRVKDLLQFPATLKGSATLATTAGKVTDVQQDPAGGHNVFIDGKRHYVPQRRGIPTYQGKQLKKGVQVRKGAAISRGPVNPHEMLPLTGVEPVQGYLADELHKIYGPHGIRRKNTEVVVKAMTNLTKVDDPGDHPQFIRGDYAPTTLVANLNRATPKGKKPITHQPILKGVNVLPLEMHEDWMARLNHERLGQSVPEAAAKGWMSNIHGTHPIPAAVYGAEFGKDLLGDY
jgi:DNA-directed RNA polymerase subunit beta'